LFIGSYVFGSVPFAVIFGRLKGVDILHFGSGNPGMTNVMRALGPGWGITCFVLDVAKGLVPCLAARAIVSKPIDGMDPQLLWFLAGLCAIVGHCASVFLRFRGGKGVSTALGAIVGTDPLTAAACFGLFLVLLAVTRYMSLASVIGVSSSILFDLLLPGASRQLLPVFVLLSVFVVYRHRKNLRRLRDGDEPKFGFKRSRPPSDRTGSAGLEALDSEEALRKSGEDAIT
jgi:glycerol-3-phosphate acyltransferase PlsY